MDMNDMTKSFASLISPERMVEIAQEEFRMEIRKYFEAVIYNESLESTLGDLISEKIYEVLGSLLEEELSKVSVTLGGLPKK